MSSEASPFPGQPGFDKSACQFALEAADIGIWELDVKTKNVRISNNVVDLLGLPLQRHSYSPTVWRKAIDPDDLRQMETIICHACEVGERFGVEFRFLSKSGESVWLQARGHRFLDESGRPARLNGVLMDITDRKKVEAASRESETRFRLLADACPDAIFVYAGGRYVYSNPAAAKIMGAESKSDLKDLTAEDFFDQSLLQSIRERMRKQLESSVTTTPFAAPFHRLDGSKGILEMTYGRFKWKGEDALQILCRDVTQQRAVEEKLRVANERLKLAVEGADEGIWDLDLATNTYSVSGGLEGILGFHDDAAPSHIDSWYKITHPDDLERMQKALNACIEGRTETFRCEYRIRAMDGSWRWMLSRGLIVSRSESGTPTAMTGTIIDITAQKESEEIIWRHANLDPLTGLSNRRHFLSGLETELRKSVRTGAATALLIIDLDGFKQVNDLCGHEAGDRLLMDAARRIKQTIRDTDGVARIGSDEFAVLLTDLRVPNRVEFVCQDLQANLCVPFDVGGESAHVSASIGVAIAPSDARTADELLRKAATAMSAAKAGGKSQFSYFAPAMDDLAHTRLRVSTELRRAIASREMFLHYQPVIDLHSGHAVKTEALLRWDHPRLGRVEPSVFIPIAEEAGLMGDIGTWAFQEAAAWTKRWSDRFGTPFQVAFNKSPAQFSRRTADTDWLPYLKQIGLPPSSVVVEITEDVLFNVSAQVKARLREFADAGIQLAIDDFGTGFSSMAYLQRFNIDYLKIDKSFIRGIPEDANNRTIAETIIVMAHKLGQKVVAEGIETKEQVEFLINAGCDFGQGFYFTPPVPAEQVESALARSYL